MENRTAGELMRHLGTESSPRGWEEFVGRFSKHLESRILRLLELSGAAPQPEDIEDLVQEVYCRLVARPRLLEGFRGDSEGEVLCFLCRIAKSVVCDRLRVAWAVKRGGRRIGHGTETVSKGALERVIDPAASPERRLLVREGRRLLVERCRQATNPATSRRDLDILHLAFLAGWSSREISEHLSGRITPSSVDSTIYRARQRLAEKGLHLPQR